MVDGDLILDVGMHRGEDTEYYLAKGFRVVAVEANPDLVASAEERFADAIESGRLRIIHAAVAERSGPVELAVFDQVTVWSSISPAFIERNSNNGQSFRTVDVPGLAFEEILSDVGIPYYMKIDIEGLDMLPVRALRAFEDRPRFVSIESTVGTLTAPLDDAFGELAEFWSLGYRRFQFVAQGRHSEIPEPRPVREGRPTEHQRSDAGSGLFGKDLPGRWHTIGAAFRRARLLSLQQNLGGYGGRWSEVRAVRKYSQLRRRAGYRIPWYDLHARLD